MNAITKQKHDALTEALEQLILLLESQLWANSIRCQDDKAKGIEPSAVREGLDALKDHYRQYEGLLGKLEQVIDAYERLHHQLKVGVLGTCMRTLRRDAALSEDPAYRVLLENFLVARTV